MPLDSLSSPDTSRSSDQGHDNPKPEAIILADWLQSRHAKKAEVFELPLQKGMMKIWRATTEISIPSLPDYGLILISVEIINDDGTHICINGHRYEHAQDGSFEKTTFDVASWNKTGQQIETPKAILEFALEILNMTYNYKPDKISAYVWGELISGMNEMHGKIAKVLANGPKNGV